MAEGPAVQYVACRPQGHGPYGPADHADQSVQLRRPFQPLDGRQQRPRAAAAEFRIHALRVHGPRLPVATRRMCHDAGCRTGAAPGAPSSAASR